MADVDTEAPAEKQMLAGTEQIDRFHDFIEEYYLAEIHNNIRKGDPFLVIDFKELSQADLELAGLLLDQPEDLIKAAEVALKQFDIEGSPEIRTRFKNLPDNRKLMIREIRSKHLGKLFEMEGVVRQKSDVRPQVTAAKFECPSCGNIITVLQPDTQFREPTRCGCGRKGKFDLLEKRLVDAQGLVLEESPESLSGGEQPKRMKVFLTDDLVSPFSERKTSPGAKIRVVGMVKEVPILLNTGSKSTKFDLLIEANYVEAVEETFFELQISEEEQRQIKELAADPQCRLKLINSVAPSIFGYDTIKEAILLQLVGGVPKKRKDGVLSRGDMHILLVGDPGAGKSALLKRANTIAPKARYVSGKGVSAAGLTASVVKDEFLRGWSLEAGAMVLASNGLCAIDEMDKISPEDRAAMHEAMENQSYHPDTSLMLSDGSIHKIGAWVDSLIEKNKERVIKGKDCEILPVEKISLLTTDFSKVFPIQAASVSRHTPPHHFIEITYEHGRVIKVTPEHPIFVWKGDKVVEMPAEQVTERMLAPAPRALPIRPSPEMLETEMESRPHAKPLTFPAAITEPLSRILGYVTTEGHGYENPRNRYAEVGISTTDPAIAQETSLLFQQTFAAAPCVQRQTPQSRKWATKDLLISRMVSRNLYSYFRRNFFGAINGARNKFVNNVLRSAPLQYQLAFLQSAFKGDGFVDSSRMGFITASPLLAKGYQDLLLHQEIWSRIDTEKRGQKQYFKVAITGKNSFKKFAETIVSKDDHRREKITARLERSLKKNNEHDIVPHEMVVSLNALLDDFKLNDGYFFRHLEKSHHAHRDTVSRYLEMLQERISKVKSLLASANCRELRRKAGIQAQSIADYLHCAAATVCFLEKKSISGKEKIRKAVKTLARKKVADAEKKISALEYWLRSPIRFLRIVKVKEIEDPEVPWVYDVTVEPTKTFLSEGLILHNTVSISKANIQATLLAKTTVLAAANPKYGRFDPYGIVAEQIDLPPTLINRFDLIFTIKDLPDEKRDNELATHMLALHQKPLAKEPEIDTIFLKKYIGYAKQNIFPYLTDEAIAEIKQYYIKMRISGSGEGSIRTIPISPRQLEALVRLSEANARLNLADQVTKEDARQAIRILEQCLMDVGFDRETGKIDIDRIATGVSAAARSNIMIIKEIINDIEEKVGAAVPLEDVLAAAKEKGVPEEKADEVIEKLKRSGEIFEPKHGIITKL
ncbi:hypothetical protein HYV84_04840 [Candidatus Woesearchaeota archaeon]|nr:hypothetical protein [Candidatus Woesearchaeota archaeon]